MDVPNRRIVILGKTGAGKSSLANTIFDEERFRTNCTAHSETSKCQSETKSVNGRNITLIDTPGFFDTDRSEEELKTEIVMFITECCHGPHAFLIVLKVEKFTEHEQAVINKICQFFSNEVFKYATVVFTHGDQLPEGWTIEDFVCQNKQANKSLADLVNKCGGRCHVIDNKYWKENPNDEYRSNQFQVKELLNTIDNALQANNGSFYTNEMLQAVEEEIQQEEKHIRLLPGNMSEEEIREQAKGKIVQKLLIKLAGIGTGVLLGAFYGLVVMVGLVLTALNESPEPVKLQRAIAKTTHAAGAIALGMGGAAAAAGGAAAAAGGAAAAAGGAATQAAGGIAAGITAVGSVGMVIGAVKGGVTGYNAAEGADTAKEAAKRAKEAVKRDAQSFLDKANDVKISLSQIKSAESKEAIMSHDS